MIYPVLRILSSDTFYFTTSYSTPHLCDGIILYHMPLTVWFGSDNLRCVCSAEL